MRRVGPSLRLGKACRMQQGGKVGHRPFAGVFGVDGFTRCKLALPTGPLHRHRVACLQVHLDTRLRRIEA